MRRGNSFSPDHTKLDKGMYVTRVNGDDIITYDIRIKPPNAGDYLSTGGMHTMEHLFSTYMYNSEWRNHVVYIGPMASRTGFVLIVRSLAPEHAIRLVREAMHFIRDYNGPIPGATEQECGNYRDQDLPVARAAANMMTGVLQGWTAEMLRYSD